MTATLRVLSTKPQKQTHTTVDTIIITPDVVRRWKNPPFQRPLRMNEKVRALADNVRRDGGVLPGIITIGVLEREEYLLDGQHRREAFLLSGVAEGYTDVRKHFFSTMAEMGEEFVNINSSLVKLRPDDILRGLEGSIPGLSYVREKCPFVGYDMIRRGNSAPILSMSTLLRSWFGSSTEVPNTSGLSASHLAQSFTADEGERCAAFLALADRAWGRDPEYGRLWGALNLTLCAWLWRRTVISPTSPKTKLSKEQFQRCLMSLSASSDYCEWLCGRKLAERDRSPAYARLKALFAKRVEADTGAKAMLPQPNWAHHLQGARRAGVL